MSTRPLQRATVSTPTRAMIDVLCDAKPHRLEDVLHAGASAALGEDYNRYLAEGRRLRKKEDLSLAEYAMAGALHQARTNLAIARRNKRVAVNDRTEMVSMPAAAARDWRQAKHKQEARQQREPVTVQPFGHVTSYAGMSEWEGWSYAPLVTRDVAHVRPAFYIDLDRLRAAFPGWEVSENPDGLISVAAHPGAPVKEVVTAWFAAQGLHHDGVRDAKNVRRRDLSQLPPAFLDDLVSTSVPFVRGLVASRYSASMQRLVGDDPDDVMGYVQLWVVELAASFDASLGRPFGTWLTNQTPRKVQDLNRASHGRTASDAEIRHGRARAAFEAQHGRAPTFDEMREILGLSEAEMQTKRRHLTTLANLRSASPLDNPDPEGPEISVPDAGPTPEERALERERSRQITLSLIASAGHVDEKTKMPVLDRPLGLLVTYLMMWDSWVKGDLIALAGCADRKVTDEVEAVHTELAKLLADIHLD